MNRGRTSSRSLLRPREDRIISNVRLTSLLIAAATYSALVSCGGSSRPIEKQTSLGAAKEAGVEVGVAQVASTAAPRDDDSAYLRIARQPWRYATFEGELITTPHYQIYTTATNDDFVDELPEFFEAALAHYRTYLGDLPQPDGPMVTYLFQDRRQWEAKTRELLPEQANIFSTLGRGGFATRGIAVLYYIDRANSRRSGDTFAIAAHEGWHQYTQRTFRNPLPVWLEEGIATYMEGFRMSADGRPEFRPWRNTERWYALREAERRDVLIPLSELLRRSPQSFLETGKNRLLVYYAQVWALTRFLVEGEDGKYRPVLEEVLQDAAEGRLAGRLISSGAASSYGRRLTAASSRSGPWIILEYFNDDLDTFEAEYLAFVEQLTSRGRR